jgi:hypothetical protein
MFWAFLEKILSGFLFLALHVAKSGNFPPPLCAKEEKELLIKSYKSLFTGRGGLTEFYVWDNNFEKRCAINEPFELATDELWKLIKPFM